MIQSRVEKASTRTTSNKHQHSPQDMELPNFEIPKLTFDLPSNATKNKTIAAVQ